jgi:hypothetical protein
MQPEISATACLTFFDEYLIGVEMNFEQWWANFLAEWTFDCKWDRTQKHERQPPGLPFVPVDFLRLHRSRGTRFQFGKPLGQQRFQLDQRG